MSLRELTSDSGEQRISCGPVEEILTRYRSHFPSLFHLGQWMCREALAGDSHKLFICGIKHQAAVLSSTDVSRPQLGGTHFECEVNQTSDLLLRLHGTFTLHKASKGDLIRPGFSVRNSQEYDFTHTWQPCWLWSNSDLTHLPSDWQWKFYYDFCLYFNKADVLLYTCPEI